MSMGISEWSFYVKNLYFLWKEIIDKVEKERDCNDL